MAARPAPTGRGAAVLAMQRLAGNRAVSGAIAQSSAPSGFLVPEEQAGSESAATWAPSGGASPTTSAMEEPVQRRIGDGHDLANPRFAGEPTLEACFDGERLLSVGASGEPVRRVQQALVDLGFPLPKFGVDGHFGSETAKAVRDFQTSAGLNPDALIGPKTMGALDARAPGGGGVTPPPPPPPLAALTVATATAAAAPDGSAATRLRIGSGETVTLTASTSVAWTTTAGTLTVPNGPSTVFKAPETGSVSVTATDTTTGRTATTVFTVVAPDSITMTRAVVNPIPAGSGGADMLTDVNFGHTDVSFVNVEWLEVPGPASNLRGYFKKAAANGFDVFHHPNPAFVPLLPTNHFRFDHCGSGFPHNPPYISLFPPFVGGGWDWSIPNRFRIIGSGTAGTFFTTTLQQFTISGTGTVTVSKQGARITRTRNNTVT